MLLAGLTIFLGAFLLFQVEPLLGKAILPWFGGAPAVWTTCLLFFQVALLAGYLYAHALIGRLSPRNARHLHFCLLLLSVAMLIVPLLHGSFPLVPSAAWKPQDPLNPVGRIVVLLAAGVGLPFLLLSSTSPLLSAWVARGDARARVYRLYAASNLGSLLALVTYPPLVERFLPLPRQALVWTSAYALFAIGSVFCLWSSREVAENRPIEPISRSGGDRLPYGFWFAAAACGSILLLASTNQMCQEVAAIPFLWVLPLVLYLLSFVLCFESDRFYRRGVFLPLLAAALGWAGLVLLRGYTVPIRIQVAAYSLALFAGCMVCHGELARSRPPAEWLTSFYLTIAAGGAAGGIFVALLAPLLFRAYWEIHVALWLAGLLALAAMVRDESSWLRRGRPWPAFLVLIATALFTYSARDPKFFSSGLSDLREAFSTQTALLTLAGGAAALLILFRLRLLSSPGRPWLAGACLAGALTLFGVMLLSEIREFLVSAISISRNFYGVLTVDKINPDNPETVHLHLRHGRIVHGFQYLAAEKRRMPTTYYTEQSGVGLALLHHPLRAAGPLRVGIVGLGTGTIASYGRAGDVYRFYEINPAVIDLSTGPDSLFTYLRDSPARIQIVRGDARLSLEREEAGRATQNFDVLAIDAFTSDAIPVHLLTRQALSVYVAHLARPDGILAVHISNRQLELEPVVRAVARPLGLSMCVVDRKGDGEAVWATTWVLLARDGRVLARPEIAGGCARREAGATVRVWTDDDSSLFEVIK
jgi:hypothetical protein